MQNALLIALKKLGLKVYIDDQSQDTSEVSSSSDSPEQDCTNKYLQKAAVFVPIVSSRYGETSVRGETCR